MNLKQRNDNQLFITLSRRNIKTLLRMLDQRVGEPTLHRQVDDNTILYVKAEEDVEHYHSEDRQASVRGEMGVGPEDVPPAQVNRFDQLVVNKLP